MAKDRFDIKEKEGMGLATHAYVIVDKETGVNYLYVHCGYGGGLTPLLDKEGKPIVTRVEGYQK
jgi:hypothetical protein